MTLLYFIVQSTASLIFLAGCLLQIEIVSPLLIILRIGAKIGVWPIHAWLIKIIPSINLHSTASITLITWQKILPIIVMYNTDIRRLVTTLLIVIITITLATPLTEISIKKRFKRIITLSSINNNAWIILSIILSIKRFILFISVYSTSLVVMLKTIGKIRSNKEKTRERFWVSAIVVGNTIGMPPIAIFWAKVKVLKTIISDKMGRTIAALMLISAAIIIYQYLKATLREIIKSTKKKQRRKKKKVNITTRIVFSISLLRAIIIG